MKTREIVLGRGMEIAASTLGPIVDQAQFSLNVELSKGDTRDSKQPFIENQSYPIYRIIIVVLTSLIQHPKEHTKIHIKNRLTV